MPSPGNIAVVLPSWVGDTVMATPALRAMREHFADGHITHVGQPGCLEILEGSKLADRVIEDASTRSPKAINVIRQAYRMRKRRFDLAVLLPNSFRAALVCKLAGAGALAGYDRDGRGWMLTDKLAPPRDESARLAPVPTIDYYNALAAMLGTKADSRRMSLAVTTQGEAEADKLLAEVGVVEARPIVMLNPGGSFGTSKLWPADRYAAVADALAATRRAQVIINAAPKERPIAASVAAAMETPPAMNLGEIANSLTLVKSLMRRSSLLITNDTGARHIAAAMGIGVVTIFGSTDPAWTRIDYPGERIVQADVPCGPCQKKACPNPPGPEFHQCMTAITVRMVLDAAEELLDSTPAHSPEGRP